MKKTSDFEYQCDGCQFAVWDCYKEPGYPGAYWSFDHCIKEDEIDEEESCGEKECHLREETIEEPYPDPPYDTTKEKEGLA